MAEQQQQKQVEEISDEHIHKKFNLPFNYPPIISQGTEKKNLLLIRHALSEFNVQYENIFIQFPDLKRTDDTLREQRVGLNFLDSPLHSIGIKQCLSQREHVNEIDTQLVLISPLQRTMQTALYLFSTHPNRSNIKFLVHPMISESLNASCCLSNKIYSTMRKTYQDLAQSFGITLDFSLLDDKDKYPSQLKWQLEQMVDAEQLKDLAKDIKDEDEYARHVSETMRQMYPIFYENWNKLLNRSKKFKEELKMILANEKKVVTIVSHANFIKCLTETGIDEKGWVIGETIRNCELLYHDLK